MVVGQRARFRVSSRRCEIFLLYLSLLAAVPVSGGVGFRQSIERIWELCRWINYALSQLSEFVTVQVLARKGAAGDRNDIASFINSQPSFFF